MHPMQMTPPLLTESWGTLWSKTCLPSKSTPCQVSSLHWHPTWYYPTATLSFVFLNELMEARCRCTSCFILEYESELTSDINACLTVCLSLSRCPSAGWISCKIENLDRETKSQYVVVVKAQDMRGKASGSTATTSVTITITDINDNIASFTRSKNPALELHDNLWLRLRDV